MSGLITDAEWQEALERARLRYRRLARYHRRTAPKPPPKTRASDIAPRRIGDGIKPNHRARAVKSEPTAPIADPS